MGHLLALIDAYLDSEDRKPAWLASKIDVSSSTVSSWRTRGSIPSPDLLRRVASVTGLPYIALTVAAMADEGRLTKDELEKELLKTRLNPVFRAASVGAVPVAERKRRGA